MATKEILEIILSWPVVFLIFIWKFKESIKLFLENITTIKVGPFEASQRQGQGKITEEKIQKKDTEFYEFAYLSLYLVYNSKLALSWFNSQPLNSSTKENFIAQFVLPPQFINPSAEKEAIFNALLVNGLIEQNGALFKIPEKGVRFLKYIKFI